MKRIITENQNGTCKYSETGLKITLHSVSEMRNIWLKSKAAFAHMICNIFKTCCSCLLKQKHISKPQKAVVVIWPNVKQPPLFPHFDSYSLLQGCQADSNVSSSSSSTGSSTELSHSSSLCAHCVSGEEFPKLLLWEFQSQQADRELLPETHE